MKKMPGFTLIEIMIAIAIVAILASVALPSYTSYIQQGRITEATNELSTTRMRLEQYYQDNRNYGSTASQCAGGAIGTSSGDNFDYSCSWGTLGTNQGFQITATGKNGMTGFVFTIDQDNARKTTKFRGATVSKDCWIRKSSDSC